MAHTSLLTILGLHVPILRTGTAMLEVPAPPPGAGCTNAGGKLTCLGPFLIHSVLPRAREMGGVSYLLIYFSVLTRGHTY